MLHIIRGLLLLFSLQLYGNNFDAELIFQQTDISVKNGKLQKQVYNEIQINNRDGEVYTKIKIPYSKLSRLSNLKAKIKDADGREIRKLKNSEIVKKSAISDFSLYEDDFILEFTLKHNKYPYTITYSYQYNINEFLYLEYWVPVLDNDVPTREAILNVSTPVDYKIQYLNRNTAEPLIDTVENIINYQWKSGYNDIKKEEVYSPALYTFFPSVRIVPLNFYFDQPGSFSTWQSYGSWQNKLIQSELKMPDTEINKIQSIVKGTQDEKEKVKLLYHYLQDATRYINITLETGGLKPYPPSYVATNKYGDCKALTNYFKSVLESVGIQSYYTKIFASVTKNTLDLDFPSQQFNHAILYVPLKNETLWLDCTSKGPFNYIGIHNQNRDAFIINKDSSFFKRTPGLAPQNVLEYRNVKVFYSNSNKDFNVKFHNSFKGYSFEKLLNFEKEYSETYKSIIARNHFVEPGFELKDFKVIVNHRDSLEILADYEAVSQDIYKAYGNNVIINNISFSLPNFEKPESRKLPVQIDYPIYKIDTLFYDLVPGFKVNKNFTNQVIDSKFGKYKIEFFVTDMNIQVVKSVLINPGYYPTADYAEFYLFIKKIRDSETKILLTQYRQNE